MWAEGLSLAFIVVLLAWMFFFTISSLPLLFLKHDVPLDAQFIRGFFDVQYLGLMGFAPAGVLCSVLAGRLRFALAMTCIALIGFGARRVIVSGMDVLRGVMTATDAFHIRKFRGLHLRAVGLNATLLAGFALTVFLASAELDAR